MLQTEIPVVIRTFVEGIQISCLDCVEDEGPETEATNNNPVDEPLLAREPLHGGRHGGRVGERGAQPEHEAVGERGGRHRHLDGEVGQEDTRGHERAA